MHRSVRDTVGDRSIAVVNHNFRLTACESAKKGADLFKTVTIPA